MTDDQVQQLSLGVYRIHWKNGGTSVASVGQLHNGSRWIAPSNWTSRCAQNMGHTDYWPLIDYVELLATH
jgi:hypothetical protein